MKLSILISCLALLIVTPSAMACGHHLATPAVVDPLSQLNLTDAQKARIAQIRRSNELPKAKRADILAVLTPAQKGQLKQITEHHKS
jgi:Spy/CpxP family protein refolding chaperone